MKLEGIRDLIFSDRYALKEPNRNELKVGDKVVVVVSTEGEWEQRSVAYVENVDYKKRIAKLRTADTDELIERSFAVIDKCLEHSPEQMWDRMAKWLPKKTEKPELVDKYQKEFRWLLDDFKFSPGGRINVSLGSEELRYLTDSVDKDFNGFENTLFNCFCLQITPEDPSFGFDSREAIMDTLKNMVSIQALGGGVGIPLSALRPNSAYVQGVNGKSSGAVSWGALFSEATGRVSQGGSRRGATLIALPIHHPDVVEFIFSKVRASEIPHIREKWQSKFPKSNFISHGIENANISVMITDKFMKAVKEDDDWDLVFPDYEAVGKDIYNRDWDGDIENWINLGHPIKVYDTVKAQDLWDCVAESAWRSAEPGILFIDTMNKENNSWYFSKIICSNPCAEQPLPDWGICLLGHINLPKFVEGRIGEGKINWSELAKTVRLGVRFLDNIIDYNPYHDVRNEKVEKDSRRIGLGTLGLGEALIRLGKRYGKKSLDTIEQIYRFIAIEAYKASIDLAKEKGAFPKFVYDQHVESGFMQRLLPELDENYKKKLKEFGIRNVAILTQAPTGSSGTMIGTSTGIEPYFAFSYWRSGRLGTREVKEKIVQEYLGENNLPEDAVLPDYFVTAMDLTPKEHILVQAIIQKWVCASISKTVNTANDFTVEETKNMYELGYEAGLKGLTLYRDGSRDSQVLSVKDDEKETDDSKVVAGATSPPKTYRPNVVQGRTEKIYMPDGKLYVTTNYTDVDGVIEVFVHGGEGNSEVSALCNYVGRLISVLRKHSIPLKEIIKQGYKVPGGQPFWYKGDLDKKGKLIANIPSVVSHVLNRFESDENKVSDVKNGVKCPSCGKEMRYEENCFNCPSCGYSKCS